MSIKTIDMSDALISLRPNCRWTIRNDVIEWEEDLDYLETKWAPLLK